MKKILLFSILSLLSFQLYSQTKEDLLDLHDKLVNLGGRELSFTIIDTIQNKSKNDLYISAKSFFAEYFKSANDVIQLDDKEAGIIGGKGIFTNEYPIGNALIKTFITSTYRFYLKIQCREGRYRAEMSNFTISSKTDALGSATGESPVSGLVERSYLEALKNKTQIKAFYEMYEPVYSNAVSILNDLKLYMSNATASENDDW